METEFSFSKHRSIGEELMMAHGIRLSTAFSCFLFQSLHPNLTVKGTYVYWSYGIDPQASTGHL